MRYIWQDKKWPHFSWDSERLMTDLGKVRLLQGRLMGQVQSLGFALSREAQAGVIAEEALKTSAIEGVELSPASIRSSVARQLGLPVLGLPPTERSVDGLVAILLDATTRHMKPLTRARIKGWQAALFPTGYSGFHKIPTGKWRSADPMQVVSGPLGRERVHFEAPPAKKIAPEMKNFLAWWKTRSHETKLDGILRAGMAHLHFVTIHPFADGNGRLARVLTDMALAQDEAMPVRFYSLSSQIMLDRHGYYDVLEHTQKGSLDITDWLSWFIATVAKSMAHSQTLVGWTLAKAGFWQKHAQTALNARQRKVVNRLLSAGPDGFVGGLTTRKYVALTKTSRVTAFREIADLLTKKILRVQKSGGRSTSYRLVI